MIHLPGWRWREAKRAHAQGVASLDAGHYERAAEHFRIALAYSPDLAPAWLNLGNAMGNQGCHRAAIACYRTAHRLDPAAPQPLVNAGYAHLTLGEWREGWWHYEQRWQIPEFREKNGLPGAAPGKRWDGVARPGQTLLVFNEQGAGDVIQMARYAPDLIDTHMNIVFRVPVGLFRLIRRSFSGWITVTMDSDRVSAHDWHAPFMSLPYLMGTNTPANIPWQSGYLDANNRAGDALRSLPRPRIGVAWAVSPHHSNDRNRSIPIELLAPLFEIPGTSWVSLQVGPKADEGAVYPLHIAATRDYWETAGVITALDLVIAVDTSVIHLAGALGVPTLGLLATPSDWRWLLDREDTPWYNSVRLIRQPRPGDWGPVVRDVRDYLHRLVEKAA